MNSAQVDPITVAVIANRLTAITKEMGQIMLLTSRSPIFSESRDFVTAIFDAEGRLIAQTAYIPVLLGSIPFAMEAIRKKYRDRELHPGDVLKELLAVSDADLRELEQAGAFGKGAA